MGDDIKNKEKIWDTRRKIQHSKDNLQDKSEERSQDDRCTSDTAWPGQSGAAARVQTWHGQGTVEQQLRFRHGMARAEWSSSSGSDTAWPVRSGAAAQVTGVWTAVNTRCFLLLDPLSN